RRGLSPPCVRSAGTSPAARWVSSLAQYQRLICAQHSLPFRRIAAKPAGNQQDTVDVRIQLPFPPAVGGVEGALHQGCRLAGTGRVMRGRQSRQRLAGVDKVPNLAAVVAGYRVHKGKALAGTAEALEMQIQPGQGFELIAMECRPFV